MAFPTVAVTAGSGTTINTLPNAGQDTMANSLPVVLASNQSAIPVGGISAVATTSFTLPSSTQYTIGDLVSYSATAATVNATPTSLTAARVNAGTGVIRRVRLSTTHTGLTAGDVFRVHIFKSAPTVTNGDNGVFSVNGVAAIHIGYADVTLDRVFNDGSKGVAIPAAGSEIVFDCGGGSQLLYVLVEARTAYTPSAGETVTVTFEILQD